MSETPRNEFVIALLTNLRQRRYSPVAWGRFLADSWRKSRATARAHPRLSRSWAHVSLLLALLAAGVFSLIWLLEGEQAALRLLPALLICITLQQGDVYVHLGLNWNIIDGRLRERLGLPTTLTLVRGLMADFLLAHLLSGIIPPNSLTLGVLLIGIASDIADGQIARRANWQTRLGGYLDSEADLYLYAAATLCALRAGVLPAWVAAILLLRFAVLLIGALVSYFVAIRQVDLTHTILGRSAGAAQAMLLMAVLAPGALAPIIAPAYLPLLLVTLALVVLAPVMEIRKNLYPLVP